MEEKIPVNISELIDLLDGGLLVVNSGLTVVLRNRAAWHRYGFPEEVPTLFDAMGPDQLEHWKTILLRAEKDRTFRTTVQGPDGNLVKVFACAGADGNTLLLLRRPDLRIEEQPLLLAYAQALAKHGIGLWRIDMATGELWWSPKCYELVGLPEGPVSTASYLEKLSEEDQATIGEHIHRETTGAGDYAPCFQVIDGENVRHVQDRTQLLLPEQANQGPVYVGAALERTREVALEARCAELEARLKATESARESSQLAGAVAHDLNNVMTALIGNAELLSLNAQSPQSAEHLDAINVAARHASALSGRMLDFVRKRPLSLKVLNLGALVQENLNFLKTLVPESVDLELNIESASATVSGDRLHLEQALFNLVLNAGQAAGGGPGRVVITVRKTQDDILMTVEDNGKGISKDEQERLFEPFYTTRIGGAGLGLSSVRQVVDHHHGTIAVTSGPGAGARFDVTLPRCIDEDKAQHEDAQPVFRSGLKIWIAEDNNMVRLVMERLLLGAQCTVRSFARSTDLIAALDEEVDVPELVITDLVMPEMSGSELFQQIRARQPGLRVLFMSGYTDQVLGDFHQQIQAGNLLHKPFERQELFNAIDDVMQRSPIDFTANAGTPHAACPEAGPPITN